MYDRVTKNIGWYFINGIYLHINKDNHDEIWAKSAAGTLPIVI